MPNNFRVRRRHDGQAISGKASFLAVAGLQVIHDATNLGEPALKRASGTRAHTLGRDIVTKATMSGLILQGQAFPNADLVQYPDILDSHVSASKVLEAEVESPELVLYSGVGAIDETTAIDTELSTNYGRHSVKQDGEEVNAILRGHLTPVDSSNPTRILIHYV